MDTREMIAAFIDEEVKRLTASKQYAPCERCKRTDVYTQIWNVAATGLGFVMCTHCGNDISNWIRELSEWGDVRVAESMLVSVVNQDDSTVGDIRRSQEALDNVLLALRKRVMIGRESWGAAARV